MAEIVREMRLRFSLLPETSLVLDLWLDLVVRHAVKGKRVHDLHLIATLLANGVPGLLTADRKDFPAVDGLSVLAPDTLIVSECESPHRP